MNRYRVIVTPEAQKDISDAYDYIAERSPMNAAKWARGLYARVNLLSKRRWLTVHHENYRISRLRFDMDEAG